MKILITGATGSLGGKLVKAFEGHNLILHGRDLNKFPIGEDKKITHKPKSVLEFLK